MSSCADLAGAADPSAAGGVSGPAAGGGGGGDPAGELAGVDGEMGAGMVRGGLG